MRSKVMNLFLALVSTFITMSMASASDKLLCDHSNYHEYLYDRRLTNILNRETGKGCQLEGINFSNEDLSGAELKGANLTGADLRGVDLYLADLTGANLEDANLRKADLFRANLQGANLRGADLSKANLRGTNLRGTYLEGLDLRELDLSGAVYNSITQFPSGFELETAGMILQDD